MKEIHAYQNADGSFRVEVTDTWMEKRYFGEHEIEETTHQKTEVARASIHIAPFMSGAEESLTFQVEGCGSYSSNCRSTSVDYALYHDALEKQICGRIKCVKITTAFKEYLERRYSPARIIMTPLNSHPDDKIEFMGIPMVVDDSIDHTCYAVVY